MLRDVSGGIGEASEDEGRVQALPRHVPVDDTEPVLAVAAPAVLGRGEALARLERDESPESALAHCREARDVARRLGDRARESVLLNSMGITDWRRGHL
jgi:hypothetical protein